MLIPLSFLVLAEAAVALLLISRIPPLYKLGRACVDLLSTAKGVAICRTLFVTFIVLLASSVSSIQRTKRRLRHAAAGPGGGHPADQILLRTQILEAAMLGYSILLAVAVNRFQAFLAENANLKLQLDVLKKQARGVEAEYNRLQSEQKEQKRLENLDDEIKSSRDVISDLRRKLEKVQIDAEAKDKEIKAAEASRRALQKQAEGSQVEYLRLLEENEHLRSQMASHDREYYNSEAKKDS